MKFCSLAILSLFIFFGTTALAQQQTITLSGKVVSADGHLPIDAANIGLPKRGSGTATNSNGSFIFAVPAKYLNDTLRVSCIGFKTRYFPVTAFKTGETFTITLDRSDKELKAVNFEYRDPMKIIQKAIAHIPDNYINHPHVIRGFYRQHTTKDTTSLQLTEAVFDIYNYGYADKREDLFKLVKARDEKNQRDFGNLELGQKPRSIFSDDIVKHLESSGILNKEGFKRHNYKVLGIIDFKGSPAYEIEFSEKEGIKDPTFRGRMYIDTKTYAFVYFDYGMSPAAMANFKIGDFAERMLMKLFDFQITLTQDGNKISYQKVGDRWVLAGVVGNASLAIKDGRFDKKFVADTKFNYVVTQVDTTQTIPFDSQLGKNQNINDYDTNDGEEFWKDYNILLPNFKTEDVFKRLNNINSVLRLKKKFEEKERKLPKDPAIRLDSLFTFYHVNGQFNGAVLIKSKGKVVLSKSYGYADKEKHLLGDEHTTYRIGSTAKTFTSVIINQLINEGKLDSLAPIKTWLPWYAHGDVTIEQLLTHRSGIPEYFNSDSYKARIVTQSFSLKDMVVNFCSDSLEFKSGTSFSYSNANFTILALVAQEVTGKPFETLLQERIFTPLQMSDTYVGEFKGTQSRQGIGYSNGSRELHYDAGNTMGAGGISSSAADMLKYHDGLLTNKLLPAAKKSEMLKPRVEFKDYNAWYDYGWMTDKGAFAASQKHVITYHPGTDVGFFTMYVRQEDNDSCIIMLNNTGDFPRYDLTDLVLNIIN